MRLIERKSSKLWFRHICELKVRYRFLVLFWDLCLFPCIFLNALIFGANVTKWCRDGCPTRKVAPDFIFDPIYWFKKFDVKVKQ